MKESFKWMYMVSLGFNMWQEMDVDRYGIHAQKGWTDDTHASEQLRFDEDYWNELLAQLKAAGCNSILLDLGEGVKYESHPEIACRGAWSKEKIASELSRLRAQGIEVYPKLNFSAGHDYWLGDYAKMLSTDIYYGVVGDLISEVAELFGKPELFHLGMDEENAANQATYNYMVVRQGEQWWYDFNKMTSAVLKAGSRPWIWSDYAWDNEELFFKNMSKDVVQSNWYYGNFEKPSAGTELYEKLEARGYDQIPTGSNWAFPDNFSKTADYCIGRVSKEHLLGLLQTPWFPTLRKVKPKHDGAVEDMALAIRQHGSEPR